MVDTQMTENEMEKTWTMKWELQFEFGARLVICKPSMTVVI